MTPALQTPSLRRLATVLASCLVFAATALGQSAEPGEQGIPVTDPLVMAKCGSCHSRDERGNLERISWARTTPENWQDALKQMILRNGLSVTPAEARAIVKEAYVYGFPLVDNYRIQYGYFVDTKNPEFKAPWNQIVNIPRVYTPSDTAIQTPNSDTPYSFVGMDLRAEPIVLTVPAIEKKRYFSI